MAILTNVGYSCNNIFEVSIPEIQTIRSNISVRLLRSTAQTSAYRRDGIIEPHEWTSIRHLADLHEKHLYRSAIIAIMSQRIGPDRHSMSWDNLRKIHPSLERVRRGIVIDINSHFLATEGQAEVAFDCQTDGTINEVFEGSCSQKLQRHVDGGTHSGIQWWKRTYKILEESVPFECVYGCKKQFSTYQIKS
jgi:hypothetical protein